MVFQNPKIQLYRTRNFSEKFNATFAYIRETWKVYLRYTLYLILPVCLAQSWAMNSFLHEYLGSVANSEMVRNFEFSDFILRIVGSYSVLIICALVGQCLLSALCYTLMQQYDLRTTRLNDITYSDFSDMFKSNLAKMVRTVLFFIAIGLVIVALTGLFAAITMWSLVVTVPLLIVALLVVFIPLTIFQPVYLFGNERFIPSLKKSFKYGFAAWGEIFVVLLVFGLLANIISSVTTMPWYLVTVVVEVLSQTNSESMLNTSVWYQFTVFVLGIIQSFGSYIAMILTITGLGFQYFSIAEKKENITFDEQIQNFDKL
jgi:hypothetical protein